MAALKGKVEVGAQKCFSLIVMQYIIKMQI